MDLFDENNGAEMEKDIFEKFNITPDWFKDSNAIHAVADEVFKLVHNVNPQKIVGRVLAFTIFIIQICVRQAKAGSRVDEEFVDMLLSSISRLGPIENWDRVCAYIVYIHQHSD